MTEQIIFGVIGLAIYLAGAGATHLVRLLLLKTGVFRADSDLMPAEIVLAFWPFWWAGWTFLFAVYLLSLACTPFWWLCQKANDQIDRVRVDQNPGPEREEREAAGIADLPIAGSEAPR